MKNINVVSLFSGIGGIDIGFMQERFNIIWANEKDFAACITYRYNFTNNHLVEKDIKKIDLKSIPSCDVIIAGFPCQPFSIAGKQKGFEDERGNMIFEIIKIVKNKHPRIVFLENVANLLNHDNGKTISKILNEFFLIGYKVKYKVMSAIHYGNIPQTRNRIYFVAFLYDSDYNKFTFPCEIQLNNKIEDIIDRTKRKDNINYYSFNSKLFVKLKRAIVDQSSIYQIKDIGIIKVKKNFCPTLTANMGTYPDRIPIVIDDYGIRTLTIEECLKFQGFPNDFCFPKSISRSQKYKLLGNSVCISVVNRIAQSIYSLF